MDTLLSFCNIVFMYFLQRESWPRSCLSRVLIKVGGKGFLVNNEYNNNGVLGVPQSGIWKLWPAGQTQPTVCFQIVYKMIIPFKFLKDWNKFKEGCCFVMHKNGMESNKVALECSVFLRELVLDLWAQSQFQPRSHETQRYLPLDSSQEK